MIARCAWAGTDPLMQDYHDREWGTPLHDERMLFEFLILEGAQAGLSWSTILNRRDGYRAAYDGFDAARIATYDDARQSELMLDARIIRNRAKVRAFRENADEQQHRSRHHKAFHDPATADALLEDDGRRFKRNLANNGVPEASIADYYSVLGTRPALESALAWYRAAGALTGTEVGTITVPTLYIWGDADATVGPSAARWTAEHVKAPYRFEILRGVGHFSTDQAPAAVTWLLLEHLAAHRG